MLNGIPIIHFIVRYTQVNIGSHFITNKPSGQENVKFI